MADRDPRKSSIETLVDRPLVQPPEGADGVGPTLGEDVSPQKQEREDQRHGAGSKDKGAGI